MGAIVLSLSGREEYDDGPAPPPKSQRDCYSQVPIADGGLRLAIRDHSFALYVEREDPN